MSYDLEHSCRICLDNKASHNIYLTKRIHNSSKVACNDMILEVFSLTVHQDDGLPPKICRKCFSKLSSAFKLKKRAEASHRTLSRFFAMSELKEEIVEEIPTRVEFPDREEFPSEVEDFALDSDLDSGPEDGHPDDRLKEESDRDFDFAHEPVLFAEQENIKESDDEEKKIKTRKLKKKTVIKKRKKKCKTEELANNKSKLEETKSTASKGIARVCPLCGKQVVDIKSHMETHKPNSEKRKLPCMNAGCPKVFISQSSRRRHVLVHHLGQLYYCELCRKEYKHGEQHIRTAHSAEPRPLGCTLCDRRFFSSAQLSLHLTSHTKERPFPCPVCGKGFRSKADGEIHRRSVHEKERNMICQYCPKGFFSNADLRKHLRSHTNERKYKCKDCGQTYSTSHLLKIHSNRHTGLKTYHCELCDKSFYTPSNLKMHMITHTKEKNYACKFCEVKFGRAHHRNRHQRTAHEGKDDTVNRAATKTEITI